jgi:hypothetical protein
VILHKKWGQDNYPAPTFYVEYMIYQTHSIYT